jgi:hypothetical protein
LPYAEITAVQKAKTMLKSQCEQAKAEYEELKRLKQEFDLEFQKAAETGNLEKVKELRAQLEQKIDALREKIFPVERLLKNFEERSLAYIEKLLAQGANKSWVAEGLAGLDSEKAWAMREDLLAQGANKGLVAIGLAGLDSEKAWAMREYLLAQGADKGWVAEGLAGLDSEKAWAMRKDLLAQGADKGLVARGLAGDYLTFVWRLRPEKEVYKLLRQEK